jgi:hypothetical protein
MNKEFLSLFHLLDLEENDVDVYNMKTGIMEMSYQKGNFIFFKKLDLQNEETSINKEKKLLIDKLYGLNLKVPNSYIDYIPKIDLKFSKKNFVTINDLEKDDSLKNILTRVIHFILKIQERSRKG